MISKLSSEVIDFVAKVEAKYLEYMQERFPNNRIEEFEVTENKKYVKVIQSGAFCFINRENGDIYMAKTFSSPSLKNPRGNLFSKQLGMEAISERSAGGRIHPHIRYLR